MADEETITVANVAAGSDAGAPVALPVVEVLTGRAFLTGKSGSGKSNTASVVVEKLLDRGFGVLIVDIEGEYYGLKEEYEILHAGADEECDIQVSEEHAGKIASLALEQNVPIILDLSGFLHEEDARDLLKAVARQLFAKEKKQKQPFLMVVEEIHEYVPEGGGMDECGRMLVKVAKRGRKHGLGVVGISQRPADVKKDFITQCDWLVWHRLTWQNDTRVVKRVLGADYAAAIEDLDDGEGFLMTDWGEEVRRVQFHRKETFDAGATPGLEDFERPDLKSVSDDLVSELQTISDEQAAREDEIGRLERELEEREQRITELKEELAEARDLSDMAEQFARAMTTQAGSRSGPEGSRGPHQPLNPAPEAAARNGHSDGPGDEGVDDGADVEADDVADAGADHDADVDAVDDHYDGADDDHYDEADDERGGLDEAVIPEQRSIIEEAAAAHQAETREVTIEPPGAASGNGTGSRNGTGSGNATVDAVVASSETGEASDNAAVPASDGSVRTDDDGSGTDRGMSGVTIREPAPDDPRTVSEELRDRVADLAPVAREMLATYRDTGVATPEAVHAAVGESGERPVAYGHNRELRRQGFVVHVGGGRYAYALPSLLEARCPDLADDDREELLATAEGPLEP